MDFSTKSFAFSSLIPNCNHKTFAPIFIESSAIANTSLEGLNTSTILTDSLISVIYLGIVPTGIAWLLRFKILKENGLIFQSQVSYLIPIFGTILGYIFLEELITIKVLISLTAVCIGIYFVRRADRKKLS